MSDSETHQLQNTLLNTDDAMVWAEEFVRIFDGRVIKRIENLDGYTSNTEPVTEGTMVGWFANMAQTAIDQYERKLLRQKEVAQAMEENTT